jgi:predicted nucleic acid-binding protein
MDFADASLVWLSAASGIRDIATLDSGFHSYRTARGKALRNRFS